MIEIYRGKAKEFDAEISFSAPVEALERPGFIRIFGIKGQEGKHRAYMLSQRALIDFEEGALEVTLVPSGESIEIHHDDQVIPLMKGGACWPWTAIRIFVSSSTKRCPSSRCFRSSTGRPRD